MRDYPLGRIRSGSAPLTRETDVARGVEHSGNVPCVDGKLTRRSLSTALLFSLLCVAVPWARIWTYRQGTPFPDREVYLRRDVFGTLVVDRLHDPTAVEYFTEEYLWGQLWSFLSRSLALGPEATLAIISFVVVLTASVLVLKHCSPAAVLFLVNPLFVDLAFSQVRFGLAAAVLTWGFLWDGKRKFGAVAIALTASTAIHTGVALMFLPLAAGWAATRPRGTSQFRIRLPWLLLAGAAAGVLAGPAGGVVLSGLDDRRVGTDYAAHNAHLVMFTVWFLLLLATIASWRSFNQSESALQGVSLLAMVATTFLVGGYASRFMAASLPYAAVAILSLEKRWRALLLPVYGAQIIAQWLSWLNIF